MRVQEAREASEKAARTKLNRVAGQAKAKQTRASRQQSPSTTRAIEHARAAGPSLREQADKARAAQVKRGEAIGDPAKRQRMAQLLNASRKIVAGGPRPIKAVSEAQRKYAEDVRASVAKDAAAAYRRPTGDLRATANKGSHQQGVIALAHTYKLTDARKILDQKETLRKKVLGGASKLKARAMRG